MSGGRLVVLDSLGRAMKVFPLGTGLAMGLATIGSKHSCDIRIMLPTVSPHHASVVVHANQTVIRNVSDRGTLVNGHPVSVAGLQHGDIIRLGGRSLRWEYDDPSVKRLATAEPAIYSRPRARAAVSRASDAAPVKRDRQLQYALELRHRASVPGGSKQVAVVQPQRRVANGNDTAPRLVVKPHRPYSMSNKRQRQSKPDGEHNEQDDKGKRKSTLNLTTKASEWIESRKSTPRKHLKESIGRVVKRGSPLRMAVLRKTMTPDLRKVGGGDGRKVQSAAKMRVDKIEEPITIDHTKQAAIMLMAGHTPKPKPLTPKALSSTKKPTLVMKASPVRSPRSGRKSSPRTQETRTSRRSSGQTTGVSVLDITESSLRASTSKRSDVSNNSVKSPPLPSPKKSAMKDPNTKRNSRKTESITFDLSNLDNYHDDVVALSDCNRNSGGVSSDEEVSLRFETSGSSSPRSKSRSGRMLESLGSIILNSVSSVNSTENTSVLTSPSSRSSRGSLIVQKALENSRYSTRTTKSVLDSSNRTVASAYETKTSSPRSTRKLETYSIVDLVDSSGSRQSVSVYNSLGSTRSSSFAFGTPANARKTRSIIEPNLLGSSTPYIAKTASRTSLNTTSRRKSSPIKSSESTIMSNTSRRSKSLSNPVTPDSKHVSVNSTRVPRNMSKSRLNDSDLMVISQLGEGDEKDTSPRSSRRSSKLQTSPSRRRRNTTQNSVENVEDGMTTPENRHSPQEIGTPKLNMQSLLDSSLNSASKRTRVSVNLKRKTIAGRPGEENKKTRGSRSKSLNFVTRKSFNRQDSNEQVNIPDEENVTPKSAVKLQQEAVKNKHSTAKKPQSKRSIIDNLNDSDIVKQLFSSPVKRKLSQSMTEFSRHHLSDDENELISIKRPTRNTIALTGRTPDKSLLLDRTEAYSPEQFVSPLSTPGNSHNLSAVKLLYPKNTPNKDLGNVKGVKPQVRTPRPRKSVKNDLTNVTGVKQVFCRSPRNSLSDVRVKEVFAASPNNDLRRVSGVKKLFQQSARKSPRNDLSDVRGVKLLFNKKSPNNDLRNVSAVKRTMRKSPNNDLTDVRGVKAMFGRQKQRESPNVSGVEELFNDSNVSRADSLFDQLLGKPTHKAIYSKSVLKSPKKTKTPRAAKSLIMTEITSNNVEEWLEQELRKRVNKDETVKAKTHDVSKGNVTKELQNLMTDTVEGQAPLLTSRSRNSTVMKSLGKSAAESYSAHTLPIKKRSLIKKKSEAPFNKSRKSIGKSIDLSNKVDSSVNKVTLPLKKRLFLHSTPVKGWMNVTAAAGDLGRVSPIATDIHEQDTLTRSTQVSPKTKGRRGTKAVEKSVAEVKSSPKKTRSTRQAAVTKPSAGKSIGAETNTKKKASSLVINKKQPVFSPKATPKATRSKRNVQEVEVKKAQNAAENRIEKPKKGTRGNKSDDKVASPKPKTTRQKKVVEKAKTPTPKKTRTTKAKSIEAQPSPKKSRRQKVAEEKPKTPKSRAKVQKTTVVVAKPSPKLKPVSKSATVKVTPKKTRSTVSKVKQSPVKEVKITQNSNENIEEKAPAKRGRKAQNVDNTIDVSKPKRGRKVTEPKDTEVNTPKPKRGRKVTESKDTEVNTPKPKRGRKVTESKDTEVNTPKPKRGRKVTESKDTEVNTPKPKRGRKVTESKDTEVNTPKPKRGCKVTESKDTEVNTPKPKRGRKVTESKDTVANTPKPKRGRKVTESKEGIVDSAKPKRGRKAVESPKPQPSLKPRKTRGKIEKVDSTAVSNLEAETKPAKANKGATKLDNTSESKATKAATKNATKADVEVKTTRGKKQAAPVEEEEKTQGRKRKIAASPAKETSRQPAAKRTRSAAAVDYVVPTATRSRRR